MSKASDDSLFVAGMKILKKLFRNFSQRYKKIQTSEVYNIPLASMI